jgi:hypothetical protein
VASSKVVVAKRKSETLHLFGQLLCFAILFITGLRLVSLVVACYATFAETELNLADFMPTVSDSDKVWLVRFTSDTKK